MTRYGQIGWRMAAFAACVGTAVLAVVLTRTPARNDVSLLFRGLRPGVLHIRA